MSREYEDIKVERCRVCGKEFHGVPVNIHGSYEYIKHTNFSNNIGVMFARTKNLTGDERVDAIVEEFFEDGNDQINKNDAIEFLECFKYYTKQDKELLDKVFAKIQKRINMME